MPLKGWTLCFFGLEPISIGTSENFLPAGHLIHWLGQLLLGSEPRKCQSSFASASQLGFCGHQRHLLASCPAAAALLPGLRVFVLPLCPFHLHLSPPLALARLFWLEFPSLAPCRGPYSNSSVQAHCSGKENFLFTFQTPNIVYSLIFTICRLCGYICIFSRWSHSLLSSIPSFSREISSLSR